MSREVNEKWRCNARVAVSSSLVFHKLTGKVAADLSNAMLATALGTLASLVP